MTPQRPARQRLSTRIAGLFLGLLLLVQGAGFVAMPPTDIPTVGRIAIFGDAQGAAIGIIQPSM